MPNRDPNRFYVYVHKRLEDGTIFYVGKGQGRRFQDFTNRSIWWERIAARHDVLSMIVAKGMTDADASSYEIKLIAELRANGAVLCNMTDGGEGRPGHISGRRKVVFCSNGMEFPHALAAAEWLQSQGRDKATSKSVSSACTGKKTIVYGFCWAHDGVPKSIELNGASARTRNAGQAGAKRVFCSNGMEFESASTAAAWCGVKRTYGGKILMCCNGMQGSAFGFTWAFSPQKIKPYIDPMELSNRAKFKPVICSNGMIFPGSMQAVEWGKKNDIRLSHSAIARAVKQNSKAGGFHWSREFQQ